MYQFISNKVELITLKSSFSFSDSSSPHKSQEEAPKKASKAYLNLSSKKHSFPLGNRATQTPGAGAKCAGVIL